MQALVYTGANRLEMQEVAVPRPGPGELLVEVGAVGICGSDMHAFHGHDERRPPPLILGHEAAGRIAEGPRVGARVTINPLVVDPDCPQAQAGRPHLSPTRQIISMPPRPGAFAQFVTIPERNALPVPEGMTLATAALTEPLAVAWHAVRLGAGRLGVEARGASVAVLGGGAIGLAAALAARHLIAGSVTIVETNTRRREVAQGQGFDAIGPDDAQGAQVDLVIDAVGAAATRALASGSVRPGGVIVHVGLLPGDTGLDIRRITLQEITVTGSYCYTPDDFADTLAAMAAGGLGALDWFEQRPLASGAEAFRALDAGEIAAPKIVLAP